MLQRSRPLSPFLNYRWQYTNTLSILHRASGIILSGAFLVLVYWIIAIARGPEAYAGAEILLSHSLLKVLLAFGVVAFAYHLCSGIRHLCWDAGFALERKAARRSAWIVAVATIVLVAGAGVIVFLDGGGVR